MFNPKLEKFLEDKKEITILGFAWACYWRLYVVIIAIAFVVIFLGKLFE